MSFVQLAQFSCTHIFFALSTKDHKVVKRGSFTRQIRKCCKQTGTKLGEEYA